MKELDNKLKTNGEQTHDELIEQIVDKWWYKFSYGIFTDEQLNLFYEELNASKLEYSEVIMAMSAISLPILPIIGRFTGSRSPPQPKTAINLPLQMERRRVSTFSKPSGVWA